MGKRPRLSNLNEEQKPGDYPGYPFYVSTEEVAKQNESVEETSLSVGRESNLITQTIAPEEVAIDSPSENKNEDSEEDFTELGRKDLSMVEGNDEQLADRTTPVDFAGSDFYVPGSELDDESGAVGAKDKENNSYSLGGGHHNDIEENKP